MRPQLKQNGTNREPKGCPERDQKGVPKETAEDGLWGGVEIFNSVDGIHDFGLCVHTLWWFSHMGSQGAPRSIKKMTILQSGK